MKKIVFVAGDKSGDSYAGILGHRLIQAYREKVRIYSFGGPELAKNSEQILDLTSHSVSGIIEALFKLFSFFRLFRTVLKKINELKPDLIILVDFPDFNLRLSRAVNKKFNTIYYISPQVWAWRQKRVEIIRKYVEKIIVIFRFEREFYLKHDIRAGYFGHPMLDIIKTPPAGKEKLILFLPGSRVNEIKKLLPIMLETKTILEKSLKDHDFAIVRPENIPQGFYGKFLKKTDGLKVLPHSYALLSRAEFIFACSGTATLELAVMEIPFLIMYRVNPLSWLLLKNMVNVEFIGMPNIIMGRKIVEEYIQESATAENIACRALEILNDKLLYERIRNDLKEVKEKLTPYNAINKTAEWIGDYLGLSPSLPGTRQPRPEN